MYADLESSPLPLLPSVSSSLLLPEPPCSTYFATRKSPAVETTVAAFLAKYTECLHVCTRCCGSIGSVNGSCSFRATVKYRDLGCSLNTGYHILSSEPPDKNPSDLFFVLFCALVWFDLVQPGLGDDVPFLLSAGPCRSHAYFEALAFCRMQLLATKSSPTGRKLSTTFYVAIATESTNHFAPS